MKKFVVLLLLMIACFTIQAQYSKTLGVGEYGIGYTGLAKDTVSATDTAFTYEYTVNKATPLFYNIACKVLKVSAGSCSISIQGRIFNTDAYTNITTYTFAGSQADTTVVFTQNTTAQFYRTYRIKVLYVSGKTKVSYFTTYLFY
jgi:hypothetical protein